MQRKGQRAGRHPEPQLATIGRVEAHTSLLDRSRSYLRAQLPVRGSVTRRRQVAAARDVAATPPGPGFLGAAVERPAAWHRRLLASVAGEVGDDRPLVAHQRGSKRAVKLTGRDHRRAGVERRASAFHFGSPPSRSATSAWPNSPASPTRARRDIRNRVVDNDRSPLPMPRSASWPRSARPGDHVRRLVPGVATSSMSKTLRRDVPGFVIRPRVGAMPGCLYELSRTGHGGRRGARQATRC